MNAPVTREDFSHFIRIDTRWGDLDTLGHVNNAVFFTFDESARLDYFGQMFGNDPKFWKDYGIILASIGCDFIAQLHHPSTLDIGLRIARIGRSSMTSQAGMFVGNKLVAVSRGTIVWFSYLQQKSLPVPENVRAMIRAREKIKPEEAA
ncbi:MAG TPA: thioesterase family protein [Nevskiaceae bacterium]|nr:thioesterase family protein [Nevskiaceae bacterium]